MKYKKYSSLFVLISIALLLAATNGQFQMPEDEEEEQMAEEEETFQNMTSGKGIFDFLKRHDCPDIQNVQNFNIDNFSGRWYEKWLSAKLGKKFKECNTMNITKRQNGFTEVVTTSDQLHR